MNLLSALACMVVSIVYTATQCLSSGVCVVDAGEWTAAISLGIVVSTGSLPVAHQGNYRVCV